MNVNVNVNGSGSGSGSGSHERERERERFGFGVRVRVRLKRLMMYIHNIYVYIYICIYNYIHTYIDTHSYNSHMQLRAFDSCPICSFRRSPLRGELHDLRPPNWPRPPPLQVPPGSELSMGYFNGKTIEING